MSFLSKLFGVKNPQPAHDHAPQLQPVIIVSGLPRSGTSMMMKMLEAGGLQVYVDNLRTPDADNPEGYYEYERVKQLDKGDMAWVKDARGQVVKVISALLEYLPPENELPRPLHAPQPGRSPRLPAEDAQPPRRSRRRHLRRGNGRPVPESISPPSTPGCKTQPNFSVLRRRLQSMLADPAPQVEASIVSSAATWMNRHDRRRQPDLYRNRA